MRRFLKALGLGFGLAFVVAGIGDVAGLRSVEFPLFYGLGSAATLVLWWAAPTRSATRPPH